MSNAIAERAEAIRHYLRDHLDQSTVRKYSFVSARYEQMKLAQIDGTTTTPADDESFREVSQMLRALTVLLGLGPDITDSDGYLVKDPQRLLNVKWLDCARMWFQ